MNREEFLAFPDVVIKPVVVKEMNDATLFVRSLNAGEKARWEFDSISLDNTAKQGSKISMTKDRMITSRERLVEIAVCNEDGTRFFKEGDAAAIGRKNANIISQLYDVAADLSGISQKDLEQITKNSESQTADVAS